MMKQFLQRFLRDTQAIALIEFVLVLPFLLLLLYGGIELTRFMIVAQRVDKSAYSLGDLINQYPKATLERKSGEISEAALRTDVFPQFNRLMSPFNARTNGSFIVTSVMKEGGLLHIKWQISGDGAYQDGQTVSVVNQALPTPGSVNPAVKDATPTFSGETLAEANAMGEGENMIVTEVFFRYRPLLATVLSRLPLPFEMGETTLSRRTFTVPRTGKLVCLPESFVYSDCS